jgi:hypothetical protein
MPLAVKLVSAVSIAALNWMSVTPAVAADVAVRLADPKTVTPAVTMLIVVACRTAETLTTT